MFRRRVKVVLMSDLEMVAELDRMRRRERYRIARVGRRIVSSSKILRVEGVI